MPVTATRKTTELAGVALEERGAGQGSAALFERILGRVHRYFFRLTRDRDRAEEHTQETLLALERSLNEGKYDATRSFNTWTFLKAHQVWVGSCRRRELEARPLPDHLVRGPTDDARGAVERKLDAARLLEQLEARLGADTLECFLLRYEGGLTLDEVATASECERRTVSRRLERAHALIDELLGRNA